MAAQKGGKLVFAARQDIDTLDPQVTHRAATRKILLQFMDPLVRLKPGDSRIHPGLAESWEVSADGKTFTFRLRKGVRFHDGTPFNAEAVKFTFDRSREPASAGSVARAFLGPYRSTEVVDEHTVRVHFDKPYAFLPMAALSPLGPVSPTAVKKMGTEFGRRPVGTGPFMVKEWVTKDHVTLVRNPHYNWASPIFKHQGPAYLDEIEWKFVLEATTRAAVLQTGEVKAAEDIAYQDVKVLERDPNLRLLRGIPAGTPWTIFPNLQKFPTSELAVRQALHHAIDKGALVRVVFHGQSAAAWSPLQPTTPGYHAAFAPYAFNPARAREILEVAGWKPGADGIRAKEGKRLELLWIFGTNNGYEEMAPLVQAQAREVGIDIQIREQPRAQMMDANRKGLHNIAEVNWWFPDPSILTTIFHSTRQESFNQSKLASPELDRLLDQAAGHPDAAERGQLYRRSQEIVAREAAAIPLVDQVSIVGVRKEVRDYAFSFVTFPLLYDVHLER
jgi:peptide/nickel transport system substrate-binding protein